MERRLLIAILLTFLVLTAYQWLLPKPPVTAPQSGTSTPPAATAGATAGSPQAAPASQIPAVPAVDTLIAEESERTIAVDNGVVRALFSNRGGLLTSWQIGRASCRERVYVLV